MIFELNNIEEAAAEKWKEKHTKDCIFKDCSFSYIFTPGGIGTSVKIKCICGKKKDITDYCSW